MPSDDSERLETAKAIERLGTTMSFFREGIQDLKVNGHRELEELGDRLSDTMKELKECMDEHEKRISTLEKWQKWTTGFAAACSGIAGYALKVFGK